VQLRDQSILDPRCEGADEGAEGARKLSSRLAGHFRYADISVLILGEAHKPQNQRQFRINDELILSEILF
jgi:hypothetical protein